MSRTGKAGKHTPMQYANRETVISFKAVQEFLFSQEQLFMFLSLDDYLYRDKSALSHQINKGLTGRHLSADSKDSTDISKTKVYNLSPNLVVSAMDFGSSNAESRLSDAVQVLKNSRQGNSLLEHENMEQFLRTKIQDLACLMEVDSFMCMLNLYANAENEQTALRAAAAILYVIFICYLAGESQPLNLQTFSQWIQVKQEMGESADLVDLSKLRFFAQFSDEDIIFPTHDECEALFPQIEPGVCVAHVDVDYDAPRHGGAVSSFCGAYIKVSNPVDLRKYRAISFDIRGEGALKTIYLEVKAYDGSPHETFKIKLLPEYVRHTILIDEFREEVPRRGANELTFVIKEASSFDLCADKRQGFFEIKGLSLKKLS